MAELPHRLIAPWAITEDGLKLVIAVATRDSYFADVRKAALDAQDGAQLTNSRTAKVENGVCVIPIHGPCFRHAAMLTQVSQTASYDAIKQDLQQALDSNEIKAIILDVDSPGGEAHGCSELSAAIYAARGIKPIIAYVSGMDASAAYWISSAASKIICDRAAILGSIGIRQLLTDDSKRDEMQGIKEYNIVSSQSPYKVIDPASADDRARMLATITQMADVFIGDVARNRGVTSEKVKADFGKGDVMVGQYAVRAGLADAVGDLSSLIGSLASGELDLSTSGYQGAVTMSKPKASVSDATCDGCDRDMDDDDKLYCAACAKYDADGDADAKALLAIVGKKTLAEAVGVISAWKEAAAQVELLRAEQAKLAAAERERKFDALLADATKEGKITPAQNDKRRQFALSFRSQENGLDVAKAYIESLPKAVGPITPAAEPAPTDAGQVALSPEERTIAYKMGISEKDLAANKARHMKAAAPTFVEGAE